ncbi:TetR/AcrR family transcriptional regulator [Microbacteriaceae bacterium K1510]|nr:TetR/AcrR family transcriptional regulator [Microbacteriaceae bacterium K1510]
MKRRRISKVSRARTGTKTGAVPPRPTSEDKGRRARNKEDKLRRIKAAARALFISKGYDATNMREIATRAGVALGTPFSYAADKRDLLFLTVNDELEDAAVRAADAVKEGAPVRDNLLSAFRVVYEFFGREPGLARLTLREMQFYQNGPQAERFLKTRERMIALSVHSIAIAQRNGEIAKDEDARVVGMVVFSSFQMAVRLWLMRQPARVADGMRELAAFVDVILKGLQPHP